MAGCPFRPSMQTEVASMYVQQVVSLLITQQHNSGVGMTESFGA